MQQPKTIARPYAKAIFNFALAEQKLDYWQQFLHNAALIVTDTQMQTAINNPNIAITEILEILFTILQSELNQFGKNFLTLLAKYHRLNVLTEIAAMYVTLRIDYAQEIKVQITSAFALTAEQKQKLIAALHERLQRKIKACYEVDNNILGGAIVRAGNLVFDGSGRKHLQQLQSYLNVNQM